MHSEFPHLKAAVHQKKESDNLQVGEGRKDLEQGRRDHRLELRILKHYSDSEVQMRKQK